jgi:hypothetical protein
VEGASPCFYLAIREDKLFCHSEDSKHVLFPDGMRILLCLKHQGVRGKQLGVPRLTEGKDVQHGLSFHDNTHLGLRVEWTLQAAHVKIDFHAKNVPVDFSSSKVLGEK